MHSILHLKSDWAVAEDDKPFEERLCQASSCGFLVHNHWAELLSKNDHQTVA